MKPKYGILMLVPMIMIISQFFLRCFSGMGNQTQEMTIARYANGRDSLILKLVHSSGANNSYTSVQLLFNNRLVDYKGRIRNVDGPFPGKVWPAHREDQQRLKPERLFLPANNDQVWTVWVNPNQFSPTDYERIKTLLTQGSTDLHSQQDTFYQKLGNNSYLNQPTLRLSSQNPATVVYADYGLLKNRLFTRTKGRLQDVITVDIGGGATISRTKGDPANYSTTLGELDNTSDTLRVDLTDWNLCAIYFPLGQLSDFTDAQGRRLTERYRVAAF